MHPKTVIEILASGSFVVLVFVAVLFLPSRLRKLGIYLTISITALLLLFFIVRPYYDEYQASKKKEYLDQYLERVYPRQKWKIIQPVGRQYNPDFFEVKFENESDWIYIYSVADEERICQRVWIPPEGNIASSEGKHYEGKNCK